VEKYTVHDLVFRSKYCSRCQVEHHYLTLVNDIPVIKFGSLDDLIRFCQDCSEYIEAVRESLDIPDVYKKAFDTEM